MLIGLTTGLRFRLAAAFAVFAALCFVAPPAVLAFGHGGSTLDCLAHADKVNHGRGVAHDMAAQGEHSSLVADHSSPAGDHQMTCCGLFCLSALVAESGVIETAAAGEAPLPALEPNLFSRVSERLDRPPISLLIV